MAYTTIDDPSAYFHIQLWTGNGTSQTITNDANAGDFSPDWVWIKNRTSSGGAGPQIIWNTTRGTDREFHMNTNEAEHTTTNGITAFNTNGFDLGNGGTVNENTSNFVGWQWIANGGTTTSFSASGSQLAGTRQSNTTSGFSIITYTGDGNNNATIPHGLNSAPKFVLLKERDATSNWYVGHEDTFTTGEIFFNLTNALASAFGPFNKTAPDSSNITLGTDGSVNGSGDAYVMFAFADVKGYSKFGNYTGNSSTDGPFIYTGFKPAFVIIKRTDATGNWVTMDSTRDTFNVMDSYTRANTNDAELTSGRSIDFLSNGFKLRNDNGNVNTNYNYIYMCFASSPFVSSEGVPTTAR